MAERIDSPEERLCGCGRTSDTCNCGPDNYDDNCMEDDCTCPPEDNTFGRLTITYEEVNTDTGAIEDREQVIYAVTHGNITEGWEAFYLMTQMGDMVRDSAMDRWDFFDEDGDICLDFEGCGHGDGFIFDEDDDFGLEFD